MTPFYVYVPAIWSTKQRHILTFDTELKSAWNPNFICLVGEEGIGAFPTFDAESKSACTQISCLVRGG